jgi:ketosteroid isomerase-like protein
MNIHCQVVFRCTVLLALLVLGLGAANSQAPDPKTNSDSLRDRIAALDRAMFDAFNRCDLDQVEAFFMPDLEFYHEKGGLILTSKNAVNVMRKSLCGKDSNRVRRELVAESLAVFPINDFGAVETGEHRFYLTQKGQSETLDGIGRFVHIWKMKDGEWRISRVVSYGFRAP